ncbi:MAG: ATP-binding protein [Sphaerochaetaceae bacterium]|nr:ATP-binding protein [Sphaerochaetaceae bacterium]
MHASLCDFLTDIVQNSIEAGSHLISIQIYQDEHAMTFKVTDDGRGMSEEQLRKALDPFYSDGVKHEHRKVGLGLPFLQQMIEETGGDFSISSKVGEGTEVNWKVPLDHIDSPPSGDIPSALNSLMAYPGDFELRFYRCAEKGEAKEEYEVNKSDLLEVLQDLSTAGNLVLMKEFLQSQETAIEEFLQRD